MSDVKRTSSYNLHLDRLKNSVADIDSQAVGVLIKLKHAGFDSYIVGGAVRDLLLGLKPKDFDIATNATPQQVKKRVPYCFIIGRRFKLVHARRGDKIFEIATYRREAEPEELVGNAAVDLVFVEENFFGNLEQDAYRRDFTINSLFYDPIDEKLVDHCQGLADIDQSLIRMIGEPVARIKEDPVRILRAVRLAHKLNFQLEPSLRKAIFENADLLERAVLPRRREEWIKLFKLPNLDTMFAQLLDLNVLKFVLPTFTKLFENEVQRESFLANLEQSRNLEFDLTNPTQLFAMIIYSYMLSTVDHPLKLQIEELSNNSDFQGFLKDELGVFKAEWLQIHAALNLIHVLGKTDSYLKKGERRKKALLNNENFLLSLRLGALSGLLTSQQISFWSHELDQPRQNFDSINNDDLETDDSNEV